MRKSDITFAQKYGIKKGDERSQYLYCKFCDHHITGGVTRLKHHLALTKKDVKVCPNASEEATNEAREALALLVRQRELKQDRTRSIGTMETSEQLQSQNVDSGGGSSAGQNRGPLNQFIASQPRQSTLESKLKKEERERVIAAIGRCIYANGLSFNVVNSPYWKAMVEIIGNYGKGLKQPLMYELRTRVLKAEVQCIDAVKATHKAAWEKYGCTLMSDGWSDQKGRSLINFLVNSPEGTFFYKSIDASDQKKTGDYLFNCLDDMVEEIGEKNVIQVMTDNHASYVNAGKKLMEKRKALYWTPCTAHCIDLLLEDIGKINIHKDVIEKTKVVVNFIYNHGWVLSLMRKYTNGKELLRPAVTRFATSFLTFQSLYKQKSNLRDMFNSDEYKKSSWAKKPNGMKSRDIILYEKSFWGRVLFCVTTTLPLVCVLREIDSDERPSMGYLYEMMCRAKEKIGAASDGIERKYQPYWKLIDKRWLEMLHRPIHAAAYFLNPRFFYGQNFVATPEIKQGFLSAWPG